MKLIDLTGQVFERLTVIRRDKSINDGRTRWLCKCKCGQDKIVPTVYLQNKKVQSCGCLLRSIRHGFSNKNKKPGEFPKLYTVWKSMRTRCENKKCKSYKNYGGRGICVAPEWDSFLSFRDHILSLLPPGATDVPKHLDIDRIDNDGDYEPGNVKLSTRSENLSHRRGNVLITVNGTTKTLTQWVKKTGLAATTIKHRIRVLKWTQEKAVLTPARW